MLADATKRATQSETRWFLRQARAPKLRTPRAFAEAEIVIPTGPFENFRFRCARQPFAGLWLDLIAGPRWNRFFAVGPSQTGKSLVCFVIPLLYHLFEIGETVICGLPSMDMAADKWREDIRPVIELSRYREFLPRSGAGSKGGTVDAIQFGHGPTLKFMSGGGNDKKRAAFTARVLVMTEVDGMDSSGGKSREADKITQMEARLRSFGNRAREYGECTASVEEGRIWTEYKRGTEGRIVLPCPHCKHYVHPEREHLTGWQAAENEHEAAAATAVCCPECGEAWTDEERKAANAACRLVHRGQEIDDDGTVHGEPPATNTATFRWDAHNNLFTTPAELGAGEWKAARAEDEENAEKEQRQFVWALPHKPLAEATTPLVIEAIIKRQGTTRRGIVPAGFEFLTAAIDVGKWKLHWSAVAWRGDGTGHVVDYGVQDVMSKELGEERAVMQALRELRDVFCAGFACEEEALGAGRQAPGEDIQHSALSIQHCVALRSPQLVFVDAGYLSSVVYEFMRETKPLAGPRHAWLPSDGIGTAQERKHHYNQPKSTGATVKWLGDNFHGSYLPAEKLTLCEVHADYWKSRAHERLTTAPDAETGRLPAGSLTLFQVVPAADHIGFAKHLTAEKQVEEFVAGKGLVKKWVVERRANHWFDTLYNACAAGSFLGVRLVRREGGGGGAGSGGGSAPAAAANKDQRTKRQPSAVDALLKQRKGGWI